MSSWIGSSSVFGLVGSCQKCTLTHTAGFEIKGAGCAMLNVQNENKGNWIDWISLIEKNIWREFKQIKIKGTTNSGRKWKLSVRYLLIAQLKIYLLEPMILESFHFQSTFSSIPTFLPILQMSLVYH